LYALQVQQLAQTGDDSVRSAAAQCSKIESLDHLLFIVAALCGWSGITKNECFPLPAAKGLALQRNDVQRLRQGPIGQLHEMRLAGKSGRNTVSPASLPTVSKTIFESLAIFKLMGARESG